jgi:hypothetical protein
VRESGFLTTKGFLRIRKKSAPNTRAYNPYVPLIDRAPERA